MELKKKEFTYRGKELDELKKLNIREFSKYLKSKQRRFILRNFQEVENFINQANKRLRKKKQIRTHKRNLVIIPEMVGMKIGIHNGKNFVFVEIPKEAIGHRLGEFSPTRVKAKHTKTGVGATKGSKSKSKK